MSEYVSPKWDGKSFHCPHCNVFSVQRWFALRNHNVTDDTSYGVQVGNDHFRSCVCEHCRKCSVWLKGKMIYPIAGLAPPPSPDLPEDVIKDYLEAKTISALSPRGAGALLRLAIQKLMPHLGQPGKNINDDIKALVAAGLPAKVQQALDAVRVVGNECVHPGQIDVRDDPATVQQLFRLVNYIVRNMITEPKEVDEIYASLPENKREAIEKRDVQ